MTIRLEKPANLKDVLRVVERDAIKNSIKFKREETQGSGEGMGFAGRYVIHEDHIEVTVTKKPFIVSASRVNNEVQKYWKQACTVAGIKQIL